MKKTHQISILLIAVIAILFSACGNSKYPGFKKTKKGLYYKFYTHNKDAKKPSIGDFLMCSFNIRTADSTFLSSAGKPSYIPLDSATFGDLFEGLKMLNVGDSVTFIVSADSIKNKHEIMQLPEFVKPGAAIYFDFKVENFKTKEAVQKEQQEMMVQKQKQMEEAKAKETTELEKYLSDNKIKAKPTESGLYFIELKKGTGAKAETGKKVKVNYLGKLIDGRIFDTNIESEAKKAGAYNDKKKFEPIEFELGKGEFIPGTGFDEGISKMRVGGKAKIIIPSKLAFGDGGGRMLPYATLVFEIELLGVN